MVGWIFIGALLSYFRSKLRITPSFLRLPGTGNFCFSDVVVVRLLELY